MAFLFWPDLFPELRQVIRAEHLDRCARACLGMTSKAEAEARTQHAIRTGYVAPPGPVPDPAAPPLKTRMYLTRAAIHDFHLAILEEFPPVILVEHYSGWEYQVWLVIECVLHNNLPALVFLCNRNPGMSKSGSLTTTAARHGHDRLLAWLLDNDWPMPLNSIETVAATSNIATLDVLMAHGAAKTSDAWLVAAETGRIDVLDWLFEHKFPRGRRGVSDVSEAACCYPLSNSVAVLEWCVTHGFPVSEETLGVAAGSGRKDAVAWLLAHDCPYRGHYVMLKAARWGRLRVMKQLHAHGVPLSGDVRAMALSRANKMADYTPIAWLDSVGCPH